MESLNTDSFFGDKKMSLRDKPPQSEVKIARAKYGFYSWVVCSVCITISICVPVVHYNHVRFKPTNAEVAPK